MQEAQHDALLLVGPELAYGPEHALVTMLVTTAFSGMWGPSRGVSSTSAVETSMR